MQSPSLNAKPYWSMTIRPTAPSCAVNSAPGLYFVGILFLHSFASMLIAGTGRDAKRVAEHLVARSSERRAQTAANAPAATFAEKRAAS